MDNTTCRDALGLRTQHSEPMRFPINLDSVRHGAPSQDHLVRVKRCAAQVVVNNTAKIMQLYGVQLMPLGNCCDPANGIEYVVYRMEDSFDQRDEANGQQPNTGITAHSLQNFLDSLTACDVDSSYDSDDDANGDDISHEQVSRTSSDTLGQEFSEYVNQLDASASTKLLAKNTPGYTQRVEFALKLGYTERLVQAALSRLGTSPAQNELLAELIKLGSQPANKEDTFPNATPNTTGDVISSNPIDWVQQPTANQPEPSLRKCRGELGPGEVEPEIPRCEETGNGLRPIVVDGSNLAMSHGNKELYSCRGIKLCVDWFRARGHRDITVFVPKWRKENSRPDNMIRDQHLLLELEQERQLVFTPSRFVAGKRQVCYDDRYILKLALENEGIIVSNDNYRDLVAENSDFRKVASERVLMYSFVNDRFMPPDDPMGRAGPTLDNFLRMHPKKSDPPPPCPYGKKCTYGNKCKFHHPERGSGPHKSITERLSEHAARHLSARNLESLNNKTTLQGKSLSVPIISSSGETSPVSPGSASSSSTTGGGGQDRRRALCRTRSGMPDISFNTSASGAVDKRLGGHPQRNSHLAMSSHGGEYNWEAINRLNDGHQQKMPCFNNCNGWQQQHQQHPQHHQQQHLHHNCLHQPTLVAHTQQYDQQDDCSNLHQKLQRQLTLNPGGLDPRIGRMQQQQPHAQNHGGANHNQQQHQLLSPHRPLAPSLSGPHQSHFSHQNVTRNSSAPDSLRFWPPGVGSLSSTPTTDTPINLSSWNQQLPHQHQPPPQAHNMAQHSPSTTQRNYQQDHRRHLHYHLASIFPEEQVQQAMQMYPDETNPQQICAAILNMFPK